MIFYFMRRAPILLAWALLHLSLNAQETPPKTIVFWQNTPRSVSDHEQMAGILERLDPHLTHLIALDYPKRSATQISSQIARQLSLAPAPALLLTVGRVGLDFLNHFTPVPAVRVVYVAHQLANLRPELLHKIHTCVLPDTAVNPPLRSKLTAAHVRLLTVPEVFHRISIAEVQKAFARLRHHLPPGHLRGVILGGDTLTTQGKPRYFTELEAERLANHLAQAALDEDATLLVVSGPRTGLHGRHRSGMDLITTRFARTLHRYPLVKYRLFPYRPGHSADYSAVLGALRARHAPIWIAGDSLNMLAETLAVAAGPVTVYETEAMTTMHLAQVHAELTRGRIHLVSKDFQDRARRPAPPTSRPPARLPTVIPDYTFGRRLLEIVRESHRASGSSN